MGKVILFERNDRAESSGIDMIGKYEIPGGKHENFDLDHRSTAVREIFEETGLLLSKSNLKYFLSTRSIFKDNEYINHFWVVEISLLPDEIPKHINIDIKNLSSMDPDQMILDHYKIISIFLSSYY